MLLVILLDLVLLWVAIEVVLRLVLGGGRGPGESELTSRVAICDIQTEGDRSWINCGDNSGPREVGPKDPEKPRVVILGGSSMRDPFSLTDINMSDILATQLPDLDIVNLAEPGLPAAGTAWVASQLAPIDPDLVVIYAGHNDYGQMTFRQRIRGVHLWAMPLELWMSRMWIYRLWADHVQGTELTWNGAESWRAGPGLLAKNRGERARTALDRVCRSIHGQTPIRNSRVVILAIQDDTALQLREEVSDRFRNDLTQTVRALDAPTVLVTLLRNPAFPPLGVLAEAGGECDTTVACYTQPPEGTAATLYEHARQTCGNAAITWWLGAVAASEAGDEQTANHAWARALALDPIPLRAPLEADDIIREVAREEGAVLLDMAEVAGVRPSPAYFHDNMHLSSEGKTFLAQTLAPVIRNTLAEGSP
jgi:hypothetical protein